MLRGYLLGQADNQLQALAPQSTEYVAQLPGAATTSRVGALEQAIGWVEDGQVHWAIRPAIVYGRPGSMASALPNPDVPTSASWLDSHQGVPVTVPATSGNHLYRVMVYAQHGSHRRRPGHPQRRLRGRRHQRVQHDRAPDQHRPDRQPDRADRAGHRRRGPGPPQPAAAGRDRADRAGHRGRRPVPPGAGVGRADRGRPARPVAEHDARPGGARVPGRGPIPRRRPAGPRCGCGSSSPTPATSCGPR